MLLVIGGQAPKAIKSVECYDFVEGRWFQVAEMPSKRCRCGAWDGGGCGVRKPLQLACYHAIIIIIIKLIIVVMVSCTFTHLLITIIMIFIKLIIKTIFVLTLKIIENKQTELCKQLRRRYGASTGTLTAGVTVLGGLVYTLGGFNGSLRVRTVEVYEPFKDQWTVSVSMDARRSTLGECRASEKKSNICFFFSTLVFVFHFVIVNRTEKHFKFEIVFPTFMEFVVCLQELQ